MAFVTCSQFKNYKEEQEKSAISAENDLLDKSSGVGGGKLTAEKIKAAIAGDVAVAVKPNSGISGDGTSENPLRLNTGDSLTLDKQGKLNVNLANVAPIRLVDASGNVHLGNIVGV